VFLDSIGATAELRRLIPVNAEQCLELGRVCFASHEQYRIYLDSGEYEAVPSGRLRWDEALPAVGDWVAARKLDGQFALIEDVLPRRSKFSRGASGSSHREQVIASNIDLAVVVCGLDHDFNLRRLERYLVLASESEAAILIVLNKTDLCDDSAAKLESVRSIAPQISVLSLSALNSVEVLRPVLRGKTVTLLGSSGAGKSTIANALLAENRQETQSVREHDSRGRHTTTARMLMPLPGGGALIDNPGMRELQLWASESSLDDVFTEISTLAGGCRFADCSHTQEPDCAIHAALDSGQLDPARWYSYQKLEAELRYQTRLQNSSAMAAQKKKWKVIHKAMRHHPKYNR
jgi:ribosome biogenesis GTPase